MTSNVLFIELEAPLTDGKAFDAFAPGMYKDMLGRPVEFEKGEVPDYVANTKLAIESTRGESGIVAGLPIDAMNHDKGNAAGWIVGVELVGDIIRASVKWTELGRDLISKGLQRFFSATVDVAAKTIIGGSLTNWPAMKENGRNKLRPIELSTNLREIIHVDSSQVGDGNMSKNDKTPDATQEPLPIPEEKQEPAIDLAALRAEIKADILAEFQVESGEDKAAEKAQEIVNLDALDSIADVSEARKVLGKEIELALRGEYKRIQANAGQMLASMMAEIKRDQHVAEFSQRVTGGTDKRPYGLPVGQEEVETFLLSLNSEQRQAAESILSRTHENGLIQFSEIGHGKRLQGTATFPPEYSASLVSWLGDGNSIKEFFAANAAELGEMGQYNLDNFEEEK